jgi:hypothetical protein
MLDQDDYFAANGKGNIVHPALKKDAFEGVDGDREVGVEGKAFEGAVKLPEGIGIAEKPGEDAVFVFTVYGHWEPLFQDRLFFVRFQDIPGFQGTASLCTIPPPLM